MLIKLHLLFQSMKVLGGDKVDQIFLFFHTYQIPIDHALSSTTAQFEHTEFLGKLGLPDIVDSF